MTKQDQKIARARRRFLGMIWERMNTFYFGGKLSMPRFEFRRMNRSWAIFRAITGRNPTVVVALQFFEKEPSHTLAELVATIGHEQIHMLQWQLGRAQCHDEFFKRHAVLLGYE